MLDFPKLFVFRDGITCLHSYNPKFCSNAIFREQTPWIALNTSFKWVPWKVAMKYDLTLLQSKILSLFQKVFFYQNTDIIQQNNQNLFATTLQRHKYTSTYETYGTAP